MILIAEALLFCSCGMLIFPASILWFRFRLGWWWDQEHSKLRDGAKTHNKLTKRLGTTLPPPSGNWWKSDHPNRCLRPASRLHFESHFGIGLERVQGSTRALEIGGNRSTQIDASDRRVGFILSHILGSAWSERSTRALEIGENRSTQIDASDRRVGSILSHILGSAWTR